MLFLVHPVFPGKDVPVRKKAPRSRRSEAIVVHAGLGVNGHGNHGRVRRSEATAGGSRSRMAKLERLRSTHGPQPNPQNSFFPFTPTPFWGEGGNTTSGAGLRGSVLSVVSVADLGWGGRATLSLQSLTPKFREEPYFPLGRPPVFVVGPFPGLRPATSRLGFWHSGPWRPETDRSEDRATS